MPKQQTSEVKASESVVSEKPPQPAPSERVPQVGDVVQILRVTWDASIPHDPERGKRIYSETAKITRVHDPGNPRSRIDVMLFWNEKYEACLPYKIGIANRREEMKTHWVEADEHGNFDVAPPANEPVAGAPCRLYCLLPAPSGPNPEGGYAWRQGRIVAVDENAPDWGQCTIEILEREPLNNADFFDGKEGSPDGKWGW